MNFNSIVIIVLLIIIIQSFFDKLLTILNLKYMKSELPSEALDIYSADKYLKSQLYEHTKAKLYLSFSIVQLLILIIAILFNIFPFIDELVRKLSTNNVLQTILFFFIVAIIAEIISIPFQIYSVFVIEQKFGFNKYTPLLYITDKLKNWILSSILGGGLLALITWVYYNTGNWFILITICIIVIFTILMNMFYTTLILPLFNKLKPLSNEQLKEAIIAFTQKIEFPLQQIYVIDSSKRTTKSNAFFSGLGRKKKIILFDTLLLNHTPEEIIAILAHEIGHYKKKHLIKGMITGILKISLSLLLLYIFLQYPNFQYAFGISIPSFHFGLLIFYIIYSPFSFILDIIANYFSRQFEKQADTFAANNYNSEHLVNALKKLTSSNLTNLTPHPWYAFVHYSHPPVLKRIQYLKNLNQS